MSVTIISFNDNEVLEYRERKYQQFLHYYKTTVMSIEDIFHLIGFTNIRNSTVTYIRNRLREEGYNSMKRAGCIRRGVWL